jgi:hypothetical protein
MHGGHKDRKKINLFEKLPLEKRVPPSALVTQNTKISLCAQLALGGCCSHGPWVWLATGLIMVLQVCQTQELQGYGDFQQHLKGRLGRPGNVCQSRIL